MCQVSRMTKISNMPHIDPRAIPKDRDLSSVRYERPAIEKHKPYREAHEG